MFARMSETFTNTDGRPTLRIERRLAHPPEKVWRAVTEPAHLSKWYPFQATEMTPQVGGKIRFDDGAGTVMDAVITEYDPPRVFAFSEHAPESMPRESDDLIHMELRPDGDGCVLVFTHVFDDRPAAAGYGTGWNACLDALVADLSGMDAPDPGDWVERHEERITTFGLDAGTAESTSDGWVVRFERQLMKQPKEKVWATITGEPKATIIASEEPTLLEYDGPDGRVRWELSDGAGGARIVLTHTGAPDHEVALRTWQRYLNDMARSAPVRTHQG
jgi:uncharacterized protein YndB with AHSA1/START domain